MREGNYTVYKHVTPNGKVYIGITSRPPEERWGKDGSGYRNGGSFRHAIKKYGWNNIVHTIIAAGLTEEAAKIAERKLIKRYKSRDNRYGYNQYPGGDLGAKGFKRTPEMREKDRLNKLGDKNPMYGVSPSKETRDKIRKANLGRKLSEEVIQHMREAQSHRSDETRKRISDSQKKTKVICVETGIEYEGIGIAAKELGLRVTGISNCIYGWSKTCGGYHWKKINDFSVAS